MLKMNDNWMPKTLKGKDLTPQLCDNEHEFYKFYALLTTMMSPDGDDRMFFSVGVRILLHEYLALVVGGKMDPYELGFADKDDKERFKMAMAKYTEILQEMGVPFKEEDNGVMAFDYDEVARRANGEA